jgi:hypothetical protein
MAGLFVDGGTLSARIRVSVSVVYWASKVEFCRLRPRLPLEPDLFLLVVRASLDLLLLLCWSVLLDIGWENRPMRAFKCFCLFNQTVRVKPQRVSRMFVGNVAS